MFVWKIAPALAAGNVIVVKPAEQTPLTALVLLCSTERGWFPPGVVNIVPVFDSNFSDWFPPGVVNIVPVGQIIMQAAGASNVKRTTLVDTAVAAAQEAVMTNAGQCCVRQQDLCTESIYDEFVKRTIEKAATRKVGDPMRLQHSRALRLVQVFCQVDEEQFNKILGLIESGKKEGAKLNCGVLKLQKGYFINRLSSLMKIETTVKESTEETVYCCFEETINDCLIYSSKCYMNFYFGPVQQIFKFKDMDEVLERANNTCYGLGAAVFTNDINKAMMFSQGVQAGSVWINCYNVVSAQAPFGGFKMSGLGREL
ncbi:ALDH1A [Mytilus edulis]|uniref:ALDH1A n=1 Tax=Mytilus edulis TaxID=6550 RepID=A0A8S3R9S8_MYTED|nr:ALDH1A [Mytilus edulis]